MKISQWQEKKFIKRIQAGDEDSFGKVYDLYVDKIYRFVFLKINNQEKAQEIVQDVFMKFWSYSQEPGKQIKNIRALLYQISRFLIIDYYRSQDKESVVSIDDINILDTKDLAITDSIEEDIDIAYSLEEVIQALEELPPHYKDIIIMKYIDDLNNKEIAAALNKEIGNIRVLAHRALEALKKIIKDKQNADH